jgi:hypothetical protein
LQFAPACTPQKIAKEYVFANAKNQAERKKPAGISAGFFKIIQ